MVPIASSDSTFAGGRQTIFVVGLGMVGMAIIEKILDLDKDAGRYFIRTCGEEDHLAYNRVGLTEFFEVRLLSLSLFNLPVLASRNSGTDRFFLHLFRRFQHRNIEDLYLNKPSWYAEQLPDRFAFSVGEKVIEIDTKNKNVFTSKGNTYQYDILILSTGSNGALPPYLPYEEAEKTKGVFVYRNVADLLSIVRLPFFVFSSTLPSLAPPVARH
jgi:nitrite reductase (NAD(P)H)